MLGINKENVKAILNKAESLYNISDFEHALVQFHKGKVRFINKTIITSISSFQFLVPDNLEFQAGILKCRKTILNCIKNVSFQVKLTI